MTQTKLAKLTGYDYIHINRVINKRRKCSVKFAEKLEEISGISAIIWIFGEKQEIKRLLSEI